MPLNLYIENLTDQERLEILGDYEEFRMTGVIGDVPLRQHARKYMSTLDMPSSYVTNTMNSLSSACHRYYALKYISDNFRGQKHEKLTRKTLSTVQLRLLDLLHERIKTGNEYLTISVGKHKDWQSSTIRRYNHCTIK